MGRKIGIKQACSIFRTNPKKGYRPKDLEELINRDLEVSKRFKEGTGRGWVRTLKRLGIIKKQGDKYYLDNKQTAFDYIMQKRDVERDKGGPTPQGYEGYQLIDTPTGIRTVEKHLQRLVGNVTYPKELIDSWVSLGILKPINPNDPAKQARYECNSFKSVISLKTCKGSFYIKTDDYMEESEKTFGKDFRKNIENLIKSQHMGFVAKDVAGYLYEKKDLAVKVDSGSRTDMVEVEWEGKDKETNNAGQQFLRGCRESVDITVIESDILQKMGDLERRHTREMHQINTDLGEQKEVLVQIRDLLDKWVKAQEYKPLPEKGERKELR